METKNLSESPLERLIQAAEARRHTGNPTFDFFIQQMIDIGMAKPKDLATTRSTHEQFDVIKAANGLIKRFSKSITEAVNNEDGVSREEGSSAVFSARFETDLSRGLAGAVSVDISEVEKDIKSRISGGVYGFVNITKVDLSGCDGVGVKWWNMLMLDEAEEAYFQQLADLYDPRLAEQTMEEVQFTDTSTGTNTRVDDISPPVPIARKRRRGPVLELSSSTRMRIMAASAALFLAFGGMGLKRIAMSDTQNQNPQLNGVTQLKESFNARCDVVFTPPKTIAVECPNPSSFKPSKGSLLFPPKTNDGHLRLEFKGTKDGKPVVCGMEVNDPTIAMSHPDPFTGSVIQPSFQEGPARCEVQLKN